MYREKFDKVEFQKTVKSNVKRLYRKTVEEATQQQEIKNIVKNLI